MKRGSQPRVRSPSIAPRRPGFTPVCTQWRGGQAEGGSLPGPVGERLMEEVGPGLRASRLITDADTWAGAREAGERPALQSSPQLGPALAKPAKPAPIWAPQAGREEGTGNNTRPGSGEGPWSYGGWRPRRPLIAYCVSRAPRPP